MELYYRTGWIAPKVHYCPSGTDSWQTAPLQDVRGAPNWKAGPLPDFLKYVDAAENARAEFVVCNNEGTQWDNPPEEVGSNNYVAKGGGRWTLRNGRLRQVAPAEHGLLIVSDLDHTMIGHEKDPSDHLLEEFRSLWLSRFAFGDGSHLVYSTGRNKADALLAAREKALPRPSLLVCGVGTEVYQVPADLPLEDGAWAEHAEQITLEPVWEKQMIQTFDRKATEELLKAGFPKFELRGTVENDPYRIPAAYEVDSALEENLRLVREALGPDIQVITSGGSEWKLVDFCSSAAGKLKACEFVMERLGCAPERTLVCGDSGNDESMYRCPKARGVAVGNSLPELVVALRSMASDGPAVVQQGAVFRTKTDTEVLYATRPCAGAIVEAVERFWPAPRAD